MDVERKMKKMTLTVKELEKDVINYLKSTIKNTPQDFKDLVDCMLLIKDKCGINLAMLASLSFSAWGEFNGVDIRLAECSSPRHTAEGEKIIATAENVSYYKKPDIDECICDYIIAKYPFFDEDSDNYDETTEDLYEELCYLIEDNYPLDVYKNNFYTLVAENIKRTLEKMLEESELASKTEEIHPLKLIHDNNLVINFGVNYKID